MNRNIRSLSDAAREKKIRVLGEAIEASKDRDEQCQLFGHMSTLIRGRSPEMVAAMEAARGLTGRGQ